MSTQELIDSQQAEIARLEAEIKRLWTANHEFIATPIADMREQRDEALRKLAAVEAFVTERDSWEPGEVLISVYANEVIGVEELRAAVTDHDEVSAD